MRNFFGSTIRQISEVSTDGFASFDGGYVLWPNTVSNLSSGLTIEFWARTRGQIGNWPSYFGIDNGSNDNTTSVIQRSSNAAQLQGEVKVDGASMSRVASSNSLLNLNTWQHIAFVADPNYVALYIDGSLANTVLQYTITLPQELYHRGHIGINISFNSALVLGDLKNCRMWSRSLTEPELQAVKEETYTTPQENLFANFILSNDVRDYSGYGHHGTIYGDVTFNSGI